MSLEPEQQSTTEQDHIDRFNSLASPPNTAHYALALENAMPDGSQGFDEPTDSFQASRDKGKSRETGSFDIADASSIVRVTDPVLAEDTLAGRDGAANASARPATVIELSQLAPDADGRARPRL